jgi:hypothetical protein
LGGKRREEREYVPMDIIGETMTRPRVVLAAKSPYPTVVIVL